MTKIFLNDFNWFGKRESPFLIPGNMKSIPDIIQFIESNFDLNCYFFQTYRDCLSGNLMDHQSCLGDQYIVRDGRIP